MNRRHWIFLTAILLIFFSSYPLFKVKSHITEDISVLVDLERSRVDLPCDIGREIQVHYQIKNNNNNFYDSKKYFFQIVLGRVPDSSGFIIREFNDQVAPRTTIQGSYPWVIWGAPPGTGSYKVFFNMYEEVSGKYPRIIAYSESPIIFNVLDSNKECSDERN